MWIVKLTVCFIDGKTSTKSVFVWMLINYRLKSHLSQMSGQVNVINKDVSVFTHLCTMQCTCVECIGLVYNAMYLCTMY